MKIKNNIKNIRHKLTELEDRLSRLTYAYEAGLEDCWEEMEAVNRECWHLRDVLSMLMREAY
jgi:ubiquinone biosynthesis protein UbiJ